MFWFETVFDTIIHSFVEMWFFPYWVIGNIDPETIVKSVLTK